MVTRKERLTLVVTLLIVFLIPAFAGAWQYEFQQAGGGKIDILSREEFMAKFGDNPDIPLTDEDVISLAKKLYIPTTEKHRPPQYEAEECGSPAVRLLFAALQNPDISDTTRSVVDSIISGSKPHFFNRTYDQPHFTFYYTDNYNDDNNVTLNDIKQTASFLNVYWNIYTTNFKKPFTHNAKEKIDVWVYYLGTKLRGQTNLRDDIIELNSNIVRDECFRKTTSAHELFHRVQFSYFADGNGPHDWIFEGTAVWSQKYTNASIRNYMSRMNEGLETPDKNLITQRSYDAAHFWVYLQERAGWDAVRDVWQTYSTNGKDEIAAVTTVVTNQLGLTFDQYTAHWALANYIKDTANPGNYEYDEDETTVTSCGVVYGPLSHVPKTAIVNANSSTKWGGSASVKPYGADYYEFNIDPKMTTIKIKIDGQDNGNFTYYFIALKNNSIVTKTMVNIPDYTYSRKMTAGQYSKIALIVLGESIGGDYTVSVNSPVSDKWTVAVGQDKTFADFNYHKWWFENDPNNPLPWPDERTAESHDSEASVKLSATPGHAGVAQAFAGVEFKWDLGQYDWQEVQGWPVRITFQFSYYIDAYWTQGTGSGNSFVGFSTMMNPWYDQIGFEQGTKGYRMKDNVSISITTNPGDGHKLTLGDLEAWGRVLGVHTYCQAHSTADRKATNSSSGSINIRSITIEFSPKCS